MNLRHLAVLLLLAGCSSTPKAKTAAAVTTTGTGSYGSDASLFMSTDQAGNAAGQGTGKSEGGGVTTPGGLFLSDELAAACGIAASKTAPKFEFDSSGIAIEDRPILQQLATCLIDGALKGRTVSLVGHTDQLGEAEYNMSLGEMRADAVRRYLHDLGVGEERLVSTSRGELDAAGENEAARSFDRRVDISLPGTR